MRRIDIDAEKNGSILFEYNLNFIDECQLGEYSTEGDGYAPCNPCPDGSWQNETGQSFCYPCEIGHVTRKEGATSGKDCGEYSDILGIYIFWKV